MNNRDVGERRALRWGPLLLLGFAVCAGAVALSALGLAPFGVAHSDRESIGADGRSAASSAGSEAAVDSEARRLARRRVSPTPNGDEEALGSAAGGAARTADSVDSTSETAPTAEPQSEMPAATFAGIALRAHLEVPENVPEPEARSVDPGRPPRLSLSEFVSGRHETVRGAVELVGDREPELEDGVPVAVTGRVLEQETGDPVSGATVIVTSTFYVRQFQYDHHLREVARVESGADGSFEIERLNADPAHFGDGGKVYVTVVHPGHATALAVPLAEVTPGFANRLPDIVLTRETHTLRGRIVDHWKKEPIVGARVVATGAINPTSYPKDQRDALFLAAPEAVTDVEGRFELTGLGAGLQHVSLHAGDDCIAEDAFTVPQTDEVEMRGHPIRGHVDGRILNADDQPVSLAVVNGGWNSSHSFGDGRFVLENFSGETVDLVVTHPEYRELRIPKVADDRTGLELRLERRIPIVRLDVRELDSDEPLRHVQVVLAAREDTTPRVTASPHFIDARGVHEIRIPDGVATITVGADGHAPEELDATSLADGDVIAVRLRRSE